MNSTTEMALIPRQSPQIPPMLEKKSNHVIFFDLSNSEKRILPAFETILSFVFFSSHQKLLILQRRYWQQQCPCRMHCRWGRPEDDVNDYSNADNWCIMILWYYALMSTSVREESISLVAMEPGYSLLRKFINSMVLWRRTSTDRQRKYSCM